jgi:ketosteroid isomerase-like protein
MTMASRGRASGAEVVNHQRHLWTLRDGKALRFEWFTDPEAALTAIGEDG